ncbi:MAG: Ppx/GppA phosphatase family protein [Bryobacteraceae bacterium]|jgi:exopolyphosphatase/guanosine-5'-triphosphate,3'-diphosphate pyrophosphatase
MPRYAAIDIGSNSIRMAAAEVLPGSPMRVLASERAVTRLGENVFRYGVIGHEALELTCDVLARMAQQYQKLDVIAVRAVATSAVRDSRNQAEFVERAGDAIGAPVEIISGREEARLIHLGVQARWPHPERKILIVDIGGGSAELIASEHGHMRDAVSRPLGAVRLREIFLKNDPPLEGELHQMREYIEEKLAGAGQRFAGRWDRVIATSATASAVVCAVNRIPRTKRDQADRMRASAREVRRIYKKVSALDLAGRRKVTGIGPRRAEIIVPGIAVLLRVLEDFGAPCLYYSAAGVRDGIIADLAARGVGRELAQLSRDQRREVELMCRRCGVALPHARQVAALAHALFTDLHPLHQLPPNYGKLLEAAAYLHDAGHFVADSNHHKHSYYLVSNSDMPGFTNREREQIANLCRYHRKSMPTPVHANWQSLNAEERRAVLLLIPLLRLADNLDVSHEARIASLSCRIRDSQVVLEATAKGDISLEQWAAERSADSFRQVYSRPVVIQKTVASAGAR